ncbi:hypothetical protein C1S80_21745 [Mycolicibacterium aubagnense]|nr:hypothetical protein C1S80_21745 [Mycolicibacterium aubagnense]
MVHQTPVMSSGGGTSDRFQIRAYRLDAPVAGGWCASRLDRVGGWVFTHDIEQIFELSKCLVVLEVLLWRL